MYKSYEEREAYKATQRLPMLPKSLARIGQYATVEAAQYACKREALPHSVVKTITWRDCRPFQCYTIVKE